MNIIIPMAGAGQRFLDAGYKMHKPAIPTTDRATGKMLPMVVCAVKDLPGKHDNGENITFIDRDFHKRDGVEEEIKRHFPKAEFITVDELTEGQACTCLLAKEKINNSEPLLIAGCDNGMVMDPEKFEAMTKACDVLVFTYRNNEAVLKNPNAYGWVITDESGRATGVSVKKAISESPMNDHAIVATFWFRRGSMFVDAAEKMIIENDRINNEFYVDQAIKYCILSGFDVRVFEIDRYICWGTPRDYEDYQNTIKYWRGFLSEEGLIDKD